jgi:hypothetical protein
VALAVPLVKYNATHAGEVGDVYTSDMTMAGALVLICLAPGIEINGAESVEWLAYDCDVIVRGKVSGSRRVLGNDSNYWSVVTVGSLPNPPGLEGRSAEARPRVRQALTYQESPEAFHRRKRGERRNGLTVLYIAFCVLCAHCGE